MIAAICLVFVFAEATRGTRGWIELPFFRFQPSELGKVLLIGLAGGVRARHRAAQLRRGADGPPAGSRERSRRGSFCLQPDLGTALVYGAVTLAIMFVAGVRWQHFAIMGAACCERDRVSFS